MSASSPESLYTAWWQAALNFLVIWGFANVFYHLIGTQWDINFVVFSGCTFLTCATVLLLIGGTGPLGHETMRSVYTWLYGLVMLLTLLFTLGLYTAIAATDASILQRFGILVSFGFAWFFQSKTVYNYEVVGCCLVVVSLILIWSDVPAQQNGTVITYMLLLGAMQAARVFLAEIHPQSLLAGHYGGVRHTCRVVGYVMFATSLITLGFSFGLAHLTGSNPPLWDYMPTVDDFLYEPTVIIGFLAGIIIAAPARYLEFSSTRVIGSANFLALAAFVPLSTLFFENIAYMLSLHEFEVPSTLTLTALALSLAGGGYIAVTSITRRMKEAGASSFAQYSLQLSRQAADPERLEDVGEAEKSNRSIERQTGFGKVEGMVAARDEDQVSFDADYKSEDRQKLQHRQEHKEWYDGDQNDDETKT